MKKDTETGYLVRDHLSWDWGDGAADETLVVQV